MFRFSQASLVFVILSVSACLVRADALQLAGNGRSDYRVVIADSAEQPIPAVAEDFVHLFEEITGARLPIVTDAEPMGPHEIIIGPSEHLDNLAVYIDWAKLGREGYVIRTAGAHLLLFGGPARGTLNAVYTFLEKYVGCRWYTPDFSVIPKTPDLSIDLIHEESTPPMEARWIYGAEPADALWAARNRLSLFSPQMKWVRPPFDRGVVEGILSHPLYAKALKFATPKPYTWSGGYYIHTFGENGLLSRDYFEEHPDYFGMDGDNKRDKRITPCLTNPAVFDLILREARKWLDQTPGANIISVSQSDAISVSDYCHCPKCKEQWPKYSYTATKNPLGDFSYTKLPGWADPSYLRPGWDPGKYHIGATGVLLDFANRVAEALKEDYPDLLVHTFAYYWSTFPPENAQIHPSVVVDFAPLTACHYHPLGSCHYNEEWKGYWTAIRKWTKVASHVWIWIYDASHVPWPGMRHLSLKFRELDVAGVKGAQLHADSFRDYHWMAQLRSFIFARILWDPQYDVAAGMKEFVEAYYGAAAQPILDCLDTAQQPANFLGCDAKNWKAMSQMDGFHHNGGAIPKPEVIRRWDALLDEAEKRAAADVPEVVRRVKMTRLAFQTAALLHLEPDDPVHVKAARDIAATAKAAGLSDEESPAASALKKAREKWDKQE